MAAIFNPHESDIGSLLVHLHESNFSMRHVKPPECAALFVAFQSCWLTREDPKLSCISSRRLRLVVSVTRAAIGPLPAECDIVRPVRSAWRNGNGLGERISKWPEE